MKKIVLLAFISLLKLCVSATNVNNNGKQKFNLNVRLYKICSLFCSLSARPVAGFSWPRPARLARRSTGPQAINSLQFNKFCFRRQGIYSSYILSIIMRKSLWLLKIFSFLKLCAAKLSVTINNTFQQKFGLIEIVLNKDKRSANESNLA